MYHPSGSVVSSLSTHSPSILRRIVPVALPTRIGDPSSTITVRLQPDAQRITSAAKEGSVHVRGLNGAALLEPREQTDDDSSGDPFKHSSLRRVRRSIQCRP